jgi:hypothetical protein
LFPCNVVSVATSTDAGDCLMVSVSFMSDIMPMFLLFPGFKTHLPEKSGGLAA